MVVQAFLYHHFFLNMISFPKCHKKTLNYYIVKGC